ncbi:MAG: thiamine pyrophosphate-dependent enzyme [Thermodesulfobacteriota bacterium]|nr:thiamine pyrophosphate-dependent enzyme [Thermodesulfobacteriota bacterium]
MSQDTAIEKKAVCKRPPFRMLPLGFCSGCHYGIIYRVMDEVLEELDLKGQSICIGGGGCSTMGAMAMDLDAFGGPHGPGAAIASALKRVYPDAFIFAIQGDGEQGAIGLGSFVATAARGENITVITMNNACYGMTGGQLAPTTLLGMVTPTTPVGRDQNIAGYPMHGPELVAPLKGVAYAARASVHTPANRQKAKKMLKAAFEKQTKKLGFGVVEFLSACPTNWKFSPVDCSQFIEEKMVPEFPLGEFKNRDKKE